LERVINPDHGAEEVLQHSKHTVARMRFTVFLFAICFTSKIFQNKKTVSGIFDTPEPVL
jgi:hypothetical protein